MTSVLLVGQAPSRVMPAGARPFEGTAALRRLAAYCGVDEFREHKLYDIFEFMNLVDEYPGPAKPGSKWDATPTVSMERLNVIMSRCMEHQQVVFLGAAARDLLLGRRRRHAPFEWVEFSTSPQVLATWSPHPGGTSMWWNDPKNRDLGRGFWTALYQEAKTAVG